MRLTPDELRITERYLWVLDYLGRCAQAVEEGDLHYLHDKAADLERAASRLEETLREAQGTDEVRMERLRDAIALHGRSDKVCQLLHPERI